MPSRLITFLLFLILFVIGGLGKDYYTILGVNKDATTTEIKSAFRKLARHPDRNKPNSKLHKEMKEIRHAFNVLSDPHKRQLYDEGGDDKLWEERNELMFHGGIDPFQTFAQLFGFGLHKNSHVKPRGHDIIVDIWATLDDIYAGKKLKILHERPVYKPANGTRECKCRTQTEVHPLVGGLIQASGTKACETCPNLELDTEIMYMVIPIGRGSHDKSEQRIAGNGEPHIDGERGDMVITLRTHRHNKFHRIKEDLYTNCTISLEEALLGFKIKLKHLSGEKLLLSREETTWPGAKMVRPGEGMPRPDKSGKNGTLYITFDVDFPRGQLFDLQKKEDLRLLLRNFESSRIAPSINLDPKNLIAEDTASIKFGRFYNGI